MPMKEPEVRRRSGSHLTAQEVDMKRVYRTVTTILVAILMITTATTAQPLSVPMIPPPQGTGLPGSGMNYQATPETSPMSRGPGMTGPMAQGPYLHNVTSASSTDGLFFTADDVILISHGSVPYSILAPDGRILLYYVDATGLMQNTLETTAVAASDDEGKTFKPLDLVILGKPTDKALDPAIVSLPDGTLRLYYYASDRQPAGEKSVHEIRTAVSQDGETFTDEGIAFFWPGLVDPDVWWNGTIWQMYVYSIAQRETIVAVSDDGVHFTYQGPLGIGEVGTTAPVPLDDGSFRLFAFEQTGKGNIISFRSEDGYTWKKEEGVRLKKPDTTMIADPSVVQLPDGTWKLFYKTSPLMEGPGQPPMQMSQDRMMQGQNLQGPAGQPGMSGPGERLP